MKLLIEENLPESKVIITEATQNTPKKYYIEGVMMQADVKNGNGRIYESKIMDGALKKYQKLVSENKALGEMGHPACFFNNDFNVLTPSGWRCFTDLNVGDIVYSKNSDNKFVETPILKIINEKYDGEGYHIKGRHIDSTVTPNHRFYLLDRYGNEFVTTIEEIYNNIPRFNKCRIIKVVDFLGEDKEYFVFPAIPDIPENRKSVYSNPIWEELKIPAEVFMKFFGLWLSEGHCSKTKHRVMISQNAGKVCDELRTIFNDLGLKYTETSVQRRDNVHVNFGFSDQRLHDFLSDFGKAHDKFIPKDIKNLSPRLLEILVDYFGKGDGRKVRIGQEKHKGKVQNVFSVSKRLVEDLQECLIKSGMHGNITCISPKDDYMFADHLIKAENKSDLYQLNISRTSGIWLDRRHQFDIFKVQAEETDGAYCLETEHGNFYVCDNGKCYLTGNSRPTIDFERVSHVVEKLDWDGTNVVGRAKILESLPMGAIAKGLIENNIPIGISSRGMGSLVERNGINYVQDDFTIAALDLVTQPSAPSAWMNGIMESAEWVYNASENSWQLAEQFKTKYNKLKQKQIDEMQLTDFQNFLRNIR